jgi:hypothetical protein
MKKKPNILTKSAFFFLAVGLSMLLFALLYFVVCVDIPYQDAPISLLQKKASEFAIFNMILFTGAKVLLLSVIIFSLNSLRLFLERNY